MSQERVDQLHAIVLKREPKYAETAHWSKVLIGDQINIEAACDWLIFKGHVRGDAQSRNDWLLPLGGLFLFRDPRIAVEFKLTWG